MNNSRFPIAVDFGEPKHIDDLAEKCRRDACAQLIFMILYTRNKSKWMPFGYL